MRNNSHKRRLLLLSLGFLALTNYVAGQGPGAFPFLPRTQFGGLTPLTGAPRFPGFRAGPLGIPGITTLPGADGLTAAGGLTDAGLAGLDTTGPINLPPLFDGGDGAATFGTFPGFPAAGIFGGAGTPLVRAPTQTLFGGQGGTVFGTTTDRRLVTGGAGGIGGATTTTGGALRVNGAQGLTTLGGTRTVTARGVLPTGTLRTTALGRLGLGTGAVARTLPATVLRGRTTRLAGLGGLGTTVGRTALARAATAGTAFGTGPTLLGGLGLDPSAMFVDPITGQRVRVLSNDDASSTITSRSRPQILTLPGMEMPREGARIAGLTTLATDTNRIFDNSINNIDDGTGRRVTGLTSIPTMPVQLPATIAGAVSGDATARFVAAAAARARAAPVIESLPTNWLGLSGLRSNGGQQLADENRFPQATSNNFQTNNAFVSPSTESLTPEVFPLSRIALNVSSPLGRNHQLFIIRQLIRNVGSSNADRLISQTVVNGDVDRGTLFTNPVSVSEASQERRVWFVPPETWRAMWRPQDVVSPGLVMQMPTFWQFQQPFENPVLFGQDTFQQQTLSTAEQQTQDSLPQQTTTSSSSLQNLLQQQQQQQQQEEREQFVREWQRRWQQQLQQLNTQQQQQTMLQPFQEQTRQTQTGFLQNTSNTLFQTPQTQFPVFPQTSMATTVPFEVIEANDPRFRFREQPQFFGEFQNMDSSSSGTTSFMMPVTSSSFALPTGWQTSGGIAPSRALPSSLASFQSFSNNPVTFTEPQVQADTTGGESPSVVFHDGSVFREQGSSLSLDTSQMQLLESTLQTGALTSRRPQSTPDLMTSQSFRMTAQAAEQAAAEVAALASRTGTGSAAMATAGATGGPVPTLSGGQVSVMTGGPMPALTMDQVDPSQFTASTNTGAGASSLSQMSFDSSMSSRTGPDNVIGATGSVDATVDIMNNNRRRPVFAIVPLTPRANVADIQNFVSQLSSSISGADSGLDGSVATGSSFTGRVSDTTDIIPSRSSSGDTMLPTIVPADNIGNDVRMSDRNMVDNSMMSGMAGNDMNSGFFGSDMTGSNVVPASPAFVEAASDFGFPASGNQALVDATTL